MKRRPWIDELEWMIGLLEADDNFFSEAIIDHHPAEAQLAQHWRTIKKNEGDAGVKPLLDEYARARREDTKQIEKTAKPSLTEERCVHVAKEFLKRLALDGQKTLGGNEAEAARSDLEATGGPESGGPDLRPVPTPASGHPGQAHQEMGDQDRDGGAAGAPAHPGFEKHGRQAVQELLQDCAQVDS